MRRMMKMAYALCLGVLLLVAFSPSCVDAWDYGDVVPVTAFIRVDGKVIADSGTLLPIADCPRFGTNKLVNIPFPLHTGGVKERGAAADDDATAPKPQSVDPPIAVRFEIGRGLKKSTKWITIYQAANASTNQQTDKYLTMVHFQFGFQMGVFNRVTSFKAYATHSERPHETIALKFDWDEHRAYNPHRALGFVSLFCLVCGIYLFHAVTRSAVGGAFHSKNVIVHDRTD